MSPVPQLCPLCLFAGTRVELRDGGAAELAQSCGKAKPAIVLECPEQDYDASDNRSAKSRSHYRRIIPLPPPAAPIQSGWHTSATSEPDGLPR